MSKFALSVEFTVLPPSGIVTTAEVIGTNVAPISLREIGVSATMVVSDVGKSTVRVTVGSLSTVGDCCLVDIIVVRYTVFIINGQMP